jgi:hypothetical protein
MSGIFEYTQIWKKQTMDWYYLNNTHALVGTTKNESYQLLAEY